MKVYINGKTRDMTIEEEKTYYKSTEDTRSYGEKVISDIRARYSVDDELAILRQRDTKPQEFQEYFDYVEEIKRRYK